MNTDSRARHQADSPLSPNDPGRKCRLVVVYDQGVAGAGELLRSLRSDFELVMVAAQNAHTAAVAEFLHAAGRVIPLDGWRHHLPELLAWEPDGITTFTELLPETAALAEALGLPYHSPETAKLLTDKRAQRARLREHGVDFTRTVTLRTPQELAEAVRRVGLPAVIKPVTGRGSQNTHRLDSQAAAARIGAELLAGGDVDYVLEEFLQGEERPGFGDYVSVESMMLPDGPHHIAVTGKYPLAAPLRECGQFWPSGLSDAEEQRVRSLATAILNALGVSHGITHSEFKLTADGPRLIEVNGRLGGWIGDLAQRAVGVDLLRTNALLACGAGEAVEYRGSEVWFQFWNQAPLGSTGLREVTGVSAARGVPGVQRYLSLTALGPLTGGVLTERLDLIAGRADSHDAMYRVLDRTLSALSYTLVDEHGTPAVVRATALPTWNPPTSLESPVVTGSR